MLISDLPGRRVRLAVLISGGGTTLENLCEKIRAGKLDAEIPLVIASRVECGGIEMAKRYDLRCEVVTRKSFGSTDDFSGAIFDRCRAVQADLVICGGFLALLQIPDDFQQRVLNIHPSLIPAFCGKGFHGRAVHEAVLKRGCKFTGCTVHFVDNEYDHGPIIGQSVVPVREEDTLDSLASRVFAAECELYPECIRQVASGRVAVTGSATRIATASR